MYSNVKYLFNNEELKELNVQDWYDMNKKIVLTFFEKGKFSQFDIGSIFLYLISYFTQIIFDYTYISYTYLYYILFYLAKYQNLNTYIYLKTLLDTISFIVHTLEFQYYCIKYQDINSQNMYIHIILKLHSYYRKLICTYTFVLLFCIL